MAAAGTEWIGASGATRDVVMRLGHAGGRPRRRRARDQKLNFKRQDGNRACDQHCTAQARSLPQLFYPVCKPKPPIFRRAAARCFRDGGGAERHRQSADQSLWRRQSDAHLYEHRPCQRRYAHRTVGDDGDRDIQCRHLRHHARHAGRFVELRADLHAGQSHRHRRGVKRDGRCADTRLWRRQSDPDLRRDPPRQWRHAHRAACHNGDRDVQRRHLRHHPRHARQCQLYDHLYARQSDGNAGRAQRGC